MNFKNIIAAGTVAVASFTGMWAFAGVGDVSACIHPPAEFKYPIKAGAQKGIIIFDEGYETMILRPGYKVENPELKNRNDAVEGFTTVAWVIPLPTMPDLYDEVDAKVFNEMDDFTVSLDDMPADSKGGGRGSIGGKEDDADSLELHEKIKIGDYTIQPIKAKGEAGGVMLNTWLKTNGFAEVKADVLKYYLDNEFFWLAVSLHNPKGLPADGDVKPLKIGFKTDVPVYPMKINQGTGEFDLEMWLITDREVDLEKTKAAGLKTVKQLERYMKQKNRVTKFSALPETLRESVDDLDELKGLKEGKLFCYRFFGKGLGKGDSLSKMKEDFKFEWKVEKKAETEDNEADDPKSDSPPTESKSKPEK